MTRRRRTLLTNGCMAVALLCLGTWAFALDADVDDAAHSEAEVRRRASLLASDIAVEHRSHADWVAALRVQEPLMYFGEPNRNNSNGSVWRWRDVGRPAVVMELYQPSDRPNDWVAVVANLSGGKVRADRGGVSWWLENQSELARQPLPDSTDLAAQPRQRLRQMRKIAERFTAHEFWDPNHSRFELRLLSQPISRYSDEQRGLVDGGVFVQANGTNPEVVLLIEGQKRVSTSRTGNTVWCDWDMRRCVSAWTTLRSGRSAE